MCSKKNITWQITSNSVRDRMIDNSLLHTFVSSRKIRRRTKILNAELKKSCSVKDYKDYINLKTNILRNFGEDCDTDDPGYLTDTDYSIIYSSESTQIKYVAERSKKYNFTGDIDYKTYKSKNNTKNTKHKKKDESKNTEVRNKHRAQRNKSLGTKHNTSNKNINVGWQEIIRQRDVSHSSDNITSTNISNKEKNTFVDEEYNFLKTQSNNQSFSQQLASQSNTLSNTIKSMNRKTKKNNRNSNVKKLHSEKNTKLKISNETEVISVNKVQNYKHRNIALNDSNSDLDSQNSHYNATPSKLTETINDFNNELNSITQNSKDGMVSSKIEVFNESKKQIYGHQGTALNESNAELESQRLHYKITLSKSTKNINDKNINNEFNLTTLNYEDGIISSEIEVFNENKEEIYKHQDAALNESNVKSDLKSPHCKATLSKSTENINNFNNELNPVILEESNSDKLTQVNNEHLMNTENCNSCVSYKSKLLKSVRRNLIPVLEEVNFTNSDKNINTDKNRENGLNHQLHLSTVNSSRHNTPLKKKRNNIHEMYNSSPNTSPLDQQKDSGFDDDSQDKLAKIEKSNVKSPSQNIAEKILVSPEYSKKITNVLDTTDLKDSKKDVSDTHQKIYDDCLGEQDNKEATESSEEERIKNSSPNKYVDLSTVNQEDKNFAKVEKLCKIKKQLLSPKQDHNTKDTDSNSHILEKQDNKTMKSLKRKKTNNLQLNKSDEEAEISINEKGEQSNKEIKEPFDEEEVKNSLQLNQVHEDAEISIKDKMHIGKSESDIQKQSLLSPKKDCMKNEHSCSNILDERNNKEVKESSEKEVKNFQQLNQIDKDIKIFSINEDETDIKLKDSCDTKKLPLPKITCTEIINTKYKIINTKINDINSDIEEMDNIDGTNEHTPVKNNTLINCSNVSWQDEVTEDSNEEENTRCISPQTQKWLQERAKLNLVVNSDSSESDNETKYVTKTSRKSIDNSDASHSSENDNLNDENNYTCEQINTDISSSEDMNENSSLKSVATNKNPLKETQCSENVNNDDDERNEHVEDIGRSSLSPSENILSEFSLRISESNVSCNNNDSNLLSRNDQSSSLNKKNVCNKNNRLENSVCTDNLETSCRSGVDISYYERPYNLQQLVENQKLLVDTLPANFTLADISDDDEAFILNIPNKVLQYNLQGELLTIKGDTIKFGKNKYKIVRKKVGTTSCVFATGKKRKPYKIVNINEISTITIQERLPPYAEKSDILTSYNKIISTKSPKINNQRTNKRELEVSDHKRKRYSSDFEIKQSVVKKKRLKVSHS